jgi:methylmalonyl-CoA mutase N-terminal domain/subunit
MRQYAGLRPPPNRIARYRYLLSQGVSGLSVAFDLPTQIGYDSDHPLAPAKSAGSASRSTRSKTWRRCSTGFRSIGLDVDDDQRHGDHPARALRRGRERRASTRRAVGHDPERHPQGIRRPRHLHLSAAPSLRIVTDIIAFCERELPQWNTISISGYHIREAGSTAVQEVAFTLAHAIAYVQAAIDAGSTSTLRPAAVVLLQRAQRLPRGDREVPGGAPLWARIMRDRFGATNPRAQQLRFHTQTAGSTLTAQQPDNNIVRVSLQALARGARRHAVVCTATARTKRSRCRPRTARRSRCGRSRSSCTRAASPTPSIPWAAAYAIEEMTNRVEARPVTCSSAIDALGGTLAAIRDGYIQRQIQDARTPRSRRSTPARRWSSASTATRTNPPRRQKCSASIRKSSGQQVERVRALRASRSDSEWVAAIAAVEDAARGGDNLVPPIINAVEKRRHLARSRMRCVACFGRIRAGNEPTCST